MIDFQFIVAELSLALAGFSGVVVAMNKQFGPTNIAEDTFGLAYILLCSGAALVFSLLPFTLVKAGIGASAAHHTTSYVLAVGTVLTGLHAAYATRSSPPRYPLVFWGLLSIGLVIGFSHLFFAHTPGSNVDLYPLLLLWLLLVAFVQFSIFIFVQWVRGDG